MLQLKMRGDALSNLMHTIISHGGGSWQTRHLPKASIPLFEENLLPYTNSVVFDAAELVKMGEDYKHPVCSDYILNYGAAFFKYVVQARNHDVTGFPTEQEILEALGWTTIGVKNERFFSKIAGKKTLLNASDISFAHPYLGGVFEPEREKTYISTKSNQNNAATFDANRTPDLVVSLDKYVSEHDTRLRPLGSNQHFITLNINYDDIPHADYRFELTRGYYESMNVSNSLRILR